MTGQTISHYRILEKLGEGGMGVVYKAEDTKLRRTVALKFLPPHATENRERFLREAQAAASLNHPNICTVHEIDEENGFLAMEFVDGLSVKEKIEARPLLLEEALDITIQTCAGLEAAHEKGIVHRDIKPANLMLTAQGQVKIMDFGLAQIDGRTRLTKAGASLGTPAYMSPEQVRGESADRRSDVWSLTAVLYEMIAGRAPFAGENEQAVAFGVVHSVYDPLTSIRVGLPIELDRIVSKALSKDPSTRYQHLADLIVNLEMLRKQGKGLLPSVGGSRGPASWLRPAVAGLLAGGLLVSAAFLVWLQSRSHRPSSTQVQRFEIAMDARLLAISPNGRITAYKKDGKGFLRHMDKLEPEEIPGSQGVSSLAWSTDGSQIVFSVAGQVNKFSLQSRESDVIAKMPSDILGLSWSPHGGLIVAVYSAGLFRVPLEGGEPSLMLAPDSTQNEFDFHDPILLADGTILCVTHNQTREWRIIAVKGKSRTIITSVQDDRLHLDAYLPAGHVLFNYETNQRGLLAVPVDAATWKNRGTAVRIEDDCSFASLSNNGILACSTAVPQMNRLLVTDRTGKVLQATKESLRNLGHPVVSPDGGLVAADAFEGGNWDIWTFDLARNTVSRFTFSPDFETKPTFSPSGDRIGYFRLKDYVAKPVDGNGVEQVLAAAGALQGNWSWSPKEDLALLQRGGSGRRLWLQTLRSGAAPVLFTKGERDEASPAISPDGRYVAYSSTENGPSQIYVRSFPEGDGKWIVSTETGLNPRWSRKGDELFWVSMGSLVSAHVELQPAFRVRSIEKLFEKGRHQARLDDGFDVLPDGNRFVTVGAGTEVRPRVIIIENWLSSFESKSGSKP